MAAEQSPVVRLLCCCCGGVTRGRQWHNQDTGHGLGACCYEFVKARTEDMERTYGKVGEHILLEPGFLFFYGSQRFEVYAADLYAAKQAALAHFKPPKSKAHMVHGMLAVKDGKPVVHTAVD